MNLKAHRTNIVLGVLALVVSLAVVWDRGRVSTAEAEQRQYQLFDAWRPDEISRVEVRQGKHLRTLVRGATAERNWSMSLDGSSSEVDEQAMSQLLLTLEFAGFERRIEGLPADKLGLEPPASTIDIHMGKLRYTLRIGGPAPSPKGARYAHVEGGARSATVYVINKELVDGLDKQARELRSKRLVPYFSSQLKSFSLSGKWTLVRGGWGGRIKGAFMLEAPAPVGKVRASWRAIDAWLTVLGNIEAVRFLPKSALAAAKPVSKLVLLPLDEKLPRAVLEIGASCPDGPGRLLIRREPDPVAACVSGKLTTQLLMAAAKLVDHHLVGTVESDVVELRLSQDKRVVEIARKGKGWHMRKPDQAVIDSKAADSLLDRLLRIEGERATAEQTADLEALGLQPPRAQLRLIGLPERSSGPKAADRTEIVDVGRVVDGKLYVRRQDDGVVLAVAQDRGAALLPAPSVLRANNIFAVRREHVSGLQLDCAGKRQRLTRNLKGSWTLLEPKATGLRADLGQANELADALRGLSAVRWVAEEPNEGHKLAKPWCSLRLDARVVKDEVVTPRHFTVRLGGEAAGGYYAQHDDERAVFVAPRALAGMARVWLLDRGALLPELKDVDRVEVVDDATKRSLTVIRRGDKWQLSTGDDRDSRAAAVGKAIEQLVADGVVRLGPESPADGLDPPRARITIRLHSKPATPMQLAVGAAGLWQEVPVRFLRAKSLKATFAVARARIKPLLDAL